MKKYLDNADVMLTELKSASVNMAAKDSIAAGLDVVCCDNVPVVIGDSYPSLIDSVIELVDSAIYDFIIINIFGCLNSKIFQNFQCQIGILV